MTHYCDPDAWDGGGGASPTAIDETPDADVTYNGATGFAVGDAPGGCVEGVALANWAMFNSLVEDVATGCLTFDVTQAGQNYPWIDQAFIENAPGVYWEAIGDFDFYFHVESLNGGDAQRLAAACAGRADDGGALASCVSMTMSGWNATTGKPIVGAKPLNATSLYTGAAVGWDIWLRITRTGREIRWRESVNGTDWTDRVGPRDLDCAGAQCRLGMFFGSNGSASDVYRVKRFVASYYPAP